MMNEGFIKRFSPFIKNNGVISPKVSNDSLDIPVGRCATFVVAANDSSTLSKQQADYVCDGTADDVQIQAAIDALPASGGKIILLEGNYDITSTIFLKNNTFFVGVGQSTILTLADSVDATMITNENATPGSRSGIEDTNIIISDMYIDGNIDNQGAGLDTLWCVGFSTVQNLIVKNIMVVNGWTAGIRTEFCTYVVIKNNRVHGAGDDAIAVNEETYYASVYGNLISNTGKGTKRYGAPCGIEIQDGARYVSVYGNEIYNTYENGIQVSSHTGKSECTDVAIMSNIVHTTESDGIIIRGLVTVFHTSISCIGNSVCNTLLSGIKIQYSGNCTCISNTITESGLMGINISNSADYCSICNNICVNNGSAVSGSQVGIGIHGTSRYGTITGNICRDSRTGASRTQQYGITLYSQTTYNQVARNILTNNSAQNFLDLSNHQSNIYFDTFNEILIDVLAVSTTHIRSNEDLSAATPITFTLDAQPDVPRTLLWSFDTHAQITEYDMEVIGVDAKGNSVTETWDETTGWSGETSNAFATITSIKMTSRTGTGAGDTMDIGITDVVGLSNVIYETSDVFKIKKNNANATVATAQVNTTYGTYDLSVIGLGAGDDFTVWHKSNLNIIS